MLRHENFVIAISSPSGAGKSTLTGMLMEKFDDIKFSTSATTRAPRNGEVDGDHYHFLNKEEFKSRIAAGEFAEWAQVFENYYGTLNSAIDDVLQDGNDVLLDIDWQGVRQISEKIPAEKLLKIFILPPSIRALEERLICRGQDCHDVIQKRMAQARDEISHFDEYDYIVINDNLQEAFEELVSLIVWKRLSRINESEKVKFVNNMVGE